jgi:hypothetical protein
MKSKEDRKNPLRQNTRSRRLWKSRVWELGRWHWTGGLGGYSATGTEHSFSSFNSVSESCNGGVGEGVLSGRVFA